MIKKIAGVTLCLWGLRCWPASMFFYPGPFAVETYLPVTKQKMVDMANHGRLTEIAETNHHKIIEAINKKDKKCYHFNSKKVRLYIVDNYSKYFIDQEGVVSLGMNNANKCSRTKIREIELINLLTNK